jgi:hypothetical protein
LGADSVKAILTKAAKTASSFGVAFLWENVLYFYLLVLLTGQNNRGKGRF